MKTTKHSLSQAWKNDKRNTLTVIQKAKHCGEIRKSIKIDSNEIDDETRLKAEAMLKADPDHQMGYFDIVLRDNKGNELDFETTIV